MIIFFLVYVTTAKKVVKSHCNSNTSLPDVFCGESWATGNNKGFVVRPLLGSTPTFEGFALVGEVNSRFGFSWYILFLLVLFSNKFAIPPVFPVG